MKKYITIAAAIWVLFSTAAPASAAFQAELVLPVPIEENGEISPHNQDIVWHYRIYNGVKQKRLWSLTERKWLTDWMPDNP